MGRINRHPREAGCACQQLVYTSRKTLPRFTPGVFGVRTMGNTPEEISLLTKMLSCLAGLARLTSLESKPRQPLTIQDFSWKGYSALPAAYQATAVR